MGSFGDARLIGTTYAGGVLGADADRERLRRKYQSLGLGELTAAVVFMVIALRWLGLGADRATSAALWSALAPLLVILIQAGSYWLLARTWVPRGEMPAGLARLYRAFRVIDILLLVAGLIGVLIWRPADVLGTALLLIIWLFGVIEFINYFVMRLAYPINRWFAEVGQRRTPRLMLDVLSSSGRPLSR
jgi:hypothetical protein